MSFCRYCGCCVKISAWLVTYPVHPLCRYAAMDDNGEYDPFEDELEDNPDFNGGYVDARVLSAAWLR